MAAEVAAARGAGVAVYDSMPSMGRKLLMAGKSGLNLTHGEPWDRFLSRFGASAPMMRPALTDFSPDALRAWASNLGIDTFVGSSGQVFPTDYKAAPLLRTWIRRLRAQGVAFHVRHRWRGWNGEGRLIFDTPAGVVDAAAGTVVLALGGASWPELGSDGAWVDILGSRGVDIAPLRPANCGFDVDWTEHFRDRFAGQPVKPLGLTSLAGSTRGEFVVSAAGIEGSGVYPHAAALRDEIAASGRAVLRLDLLPDRSPGSIAAALGAPRGSRSLADHLRRTLALTSVKAGLLRECLEPDELADLGRIARAVKALQLTLTRPRPLAEAISTAGGVTWQALTDDLMLRGLPGVFVAGEMIDWEVTTGGYLLNAVMALGRRAGAGAADWALGASAQRS